jgi:hypothetical protein
MPKTTSLEYAIMLYNYIVQVFLRKDMITTLIFINQKKPCIGLELDLKVQQTKEDIEKEKESR